MSLIPVLEAEAGESCEFEASLRLPVTFLESKGKVVGEYSPVHGHRSQRDQL